LVLVLELLGRQFMKLLFMEFRDFRDFRVFKVFKVSKDVRVF
jgi:hypothetical protein